MLRVGIFTDNDFSKVNGVTTTLRALLERPPDDLRPRIYTCEDRASESAQYVALKAVGMGIPFYPEMKMYFPPFRRFLQRVAEDRIDVVHFTTPGPVGLAAMYVASKLGLPMVGSFHTDLAAYTRLLSGSERLGRLMQQYLRWPYGKCRRIFVPSEATRATLVEGQIDPRKIRLWKRGVSTERFTPARRSSTLRARWGIDQHQLVLLYVGRVSREKGLDMLPALSTRLRRSGIDHQLIVVGDGPMRAELQAECPIAIFTGTLAADEVADVMASSDVFVFPSRTDTAGNVVLEAQASGLPVLVTDAGGPKEQMSDRVTGFVCRDLAAFHARIAELALDPLVRMQVSTRARAFAEERDWPNALAPIFDAYRDAAAQSQAAAALTTRSMVATRGTSR